MMAHAERVPQRGRPPVNATPPVDAASTRPLTIAGGGLAAMAAAIGIGRFAYTPILPPMAAALGLSQAMAGLIASANFLGYLGGAILTATPYVRGSRRAWLLGGLAVSAVTTGGMGLASSTPAFVVLRFIGGAASALSLVFSSALVLDRLMSTGRSTLSAVHFAGVGTGITISAALVSVLLGLGFDWRAPWLACGAAALIALVIVAALVPEGRERAPVASRPAGSVRGLPCLALAYGLFGFGYVITATFLVAIVRASVAVRPLEPYVWGVVGLTAVPSVALWTWAGRHLGQAPAFALACAMEAAGIAASVVWTSTAGILLAAALLGGTFMGLTALGLIQGLALAAGDPRRALATLTAAFGAGQIVGPAFAGAVSDATGSFLAPSLVAVAALLGGGALAIVAESRAVR
jgi:predicted MFS family arabinose efflux permease